MLTYVDGLESDLSAFHGLEFYTTSVALVMRLARSLPVYQGALWLAMAAERRQTAPPVELPTVHPQPVDRSTEDTPDYLVAQLQQRAMTAKYQAMGVHVTGVETISDTELERLVSSG